MAISALYAPNDWIYIICKKSCYIRQLRMSGPIYAPKRVKMATAYSIICSGIQLYQWEPTYQEYALMTIKNAFRKDKFNAYKAEAEESTTVSTMSLRSANAGTTDENTNPAVDPVEGTTGVEGVTTNETPEETKDETLTGTEETVEETDKESEEKTEETSETEEEKNEAGSEETTETDEEVAAENSEEKTEETSETEEEKTEEKADTSKSGNKSGKNKNKNK